MNNKLPPKELLNKIFSYKEDGNLVWRKRDINQISDLRILNTWNTRYAGNDAGRPLKSGYIGVGIKYNGQNKRYSLHRLIYAWHFFDVAEKEIDHKNGNVRDNRIENLRIATRYENSKNTFVRKDSSTQVKGVYPHKKGGWIASIKNNKKEEIKYFSKFEDAKFWVESMREKLHGDFLNHGIK